MGGDGCGSGKVDGRPKLLLPLTAHSHSNIHTTAHSHVFHYQSIHAFMRVVQEEEMDFITFPEARASIRAMAFRPKATPPRAYS